MSRKQKIKHMTPEELKSKLYSHFQKTGSLDHLKSQLRGQLVSELFKVADNVDSIPVSMAADVEKCLLPLQVCNWLIYDHLSRQDYQYSLSTFVTEAHLPNPEKLLTAGDILGLLGFSSNSPEFQKISKLYAENNELECLNSLFLSIIKALFNIPNKDSLLNFSQIGEFNNTLKKDIDNSESTNKLIDNNRASCDVPLQNQFLKSKNMSMDKSFLSNDMHSAESSFHEQLQSVKKENERAVQKLRHKLLEELENLHTQEHKMQMELELEKTELRREQSKLLKEKESLKEKEILLEKEIANKYEHKMRQFNEDFASKLHFKEKEIDNIKTKLFEKEQKLLQVEAELTNQKDDYSLIKSELDDLRHEYKIIQNKYTAELAKNTNLIKKFDDMADYSIVKDELSSKSKEVFKLQNEIKDIHQKSEIERKKFVETVRNLEDNLNTKEPQLIQAQRELDHVQSTFSSKEATWKKEKRKLQQELDEFKILYEKVLERFQEQQDDMQDLHKTINILNYKVNNNVVNISKPESFNSYKNYQRTSEMSMRNKSQVLFTKRNPPPQNPSEIYKDTSLKFISDAKNRFGKLNQEENAIQEKCSYIFSTMPENKHTESTYSDNFTSIHKSNFENYELPSLKDIPLSSGFNSGNYSLNKISTSKSPYTLTNVKRMVSHSLFPISNQNNYHQHTDFLSMYSKGRNVLNKYTDVSIEPSACTETCPKQPVASKPREDDMTCGSEKFGNSQNINCSRKDESDINVQKNFSEESNLPVSSNCKGSSLQSTEVVESLSAAQPTLQKEMLTSAAVIPAVSSKTSSSPNKESGDTFLINLDAAWKRQTSTLPSLEQNINKTTFKEKVGNVSELKSLENIESTEKTHSLQSKKNGNAFQLKEKENISLTQNSKTANNDLKSAPDNVEGTTKTDDVHKLKENSLTVFDKGSGLIQNTKVTDAENYNFPELTNKEISSFPQSSTSKIHVNPVENENKLKESLGSNITLNTSRNSEQKLDLTNTAQNISSNPTSNECELNLKLNTNLNAENANDNFAKSSEKIASADSLSELSEIHLSCGSEGEQQKEDSDAW